MSWLDWNRGRSVRVPVVDDAGVLWVGDRRAVGAGTVRLLRASRGGWEQLWSGGSPTGREPEPDAKYRLRRAGSGRVAGRPVTIVEAVLLSDSTVRERVFLDDAPAWCSAGRPRRHGHGDPLGRVPGDLGARPGGRAARDPARALSPGAGDPPGGFRAAPLPGAGTGRARLRPGGPLPAARRRRAALLQRRGVRVVVFEQRGRLDCGRRCPRAGHRSRPTGAGSGRPHAGRDDRGVGGLGRRLHLRDRRSRGRRSSRSWRRSPLGGARAWSRVTDLVCAPSGGADRSAQGAAGRQAARRRDLRMRRRSRSDAPPQTPWSMRCSSAYSEALSRTGQRLAEAPGGVDARAVGGEEVRRAWPRHRASSIQRCSRVVLVGYRVCCRTRSPWACCPGSAGGATRDHTAPVAIVEPSWASVDEAP